MSGVVTTIVELLALAVTMYLTRSINREIKS